MNKKLLQLVPIFLAIIAFSFFFWLSTENGMNKTADSEHYLNVARQIYQNGFISIWKNKQLVYWPPLYPLVLSAINGFDDPAQIRLLHYFVAIMILIIWNYISFKLFATWKRRLAFMILLGLSTHFLMISVFVWSELIFLLLLSLQIICTQKFVNNGNINWLLISILPAFLMLIQRNAGIFIISPIYLSLIFFKVIRKSQYWIAAVSYGLSISGFLVWNVKNIIVESRPHMIYELVPYFTPYKNLSLVLNELGGAMYPSLLIYPYSVVITIAILSVIFYDVFYSSNELFLKILMFSILCYSSIWFIIPGDPSNMGRFISVIVPIMLMLTVWVVFSVRFRLRRIFKYMIISIFFLYSTTRIVNNALLWGGKSEYINFGKMHNNLFYEKSDRIIGKPQSD